MKSPTFISIYNPNDSNKSYTLSTVFHPGTEFWLCSEEGEGMGMSAQVLFDHIDKWFKKNML